MHAHLEGEIGIITHIHFDGMDEGKGDTQAGTGEARYRLTHDYLVPPLRAWLARDGVSDCESRDESSADDRTVLRPSSRRPRSRTTRKVGAADVPLSRGRPIEINSATEDDLKSLPGIGPASARLIIGSRPYKSIDDLLRVRGMSRTRLSGIRSFVVVG